MKVLVLVHRNQNCTRVCVRAPIGQWDIEKKGFFDESTLKKFFLCKVTPSFTGKLYLEIKSTKKMM